MLLVYLKVFRSVFVLVNQNAHNFNLDNANTSSTSVANQLELILLKVNFAKFSSSAVAGCYRITSPILLEFILLGNLNWKMLTLPPCVQLLLDALNISQIFHSPTRFNSNNMNSGTLNNAGSGHFDLLYRYQRKFWYWAIFSQKYWYFCWACTPVTKQNKSTYFHQVLVNTFVLFCLLQTVSARYSEGPL